MKSAHFYEKNNNGVGTSSHNNSKRYRNGNGRSRKFTEVTFDFMEEKVLSYASLACGARSKTGGVKCSVRCQKPKTKQDDLQCDL